MFDCTRGMTTQNFIAQGLTTMAGRVTQDLFEASEPNKNNALLCLIRGFKKQLL